MSARAPRFAAVGVGRAQARGRAAQPLGGQPSVSGVALTETSGSRHWVSASRPLAAVTGRGQDT